MSNLHPARRVLQGYAREGGAPCGVVEGWRVLSPARQVAYAFGVFGTSLLQQTVLLWTFYYYAPPPDQGLPQRATPTLLGIAMGLGRLVDALVDPPIAHWSDGHRSRGGRRRPFIFIGAPLLAVVFALLWRPPDAAVTTANFVYLTVLLGLFFLLFTLVLNPYMALLPEVTHAGRERIATAAWQTIFTLVGTAAAYLASAQLASRQGFPVMGMVLAPLGMIPMLLAGLAIREHPIADTRLHFTAALRAVFGNLRFRIFISGFALLWLGLSMVQLTLALFVTVLMDLPRAAVGTILAVGVATTILTTPAVTALAHRIGTHRTLLAAMGTSGATLALMATVGWWPVPLSAAAQGYVVIALAAPSLAALFTLPNTLLADIAHTVAAERGQRLEGMFFAFQGLVLNGATSLASILLGGVLAAWGYDLGLRIVPLLAAACVIVGTAVFRRFPATRSERVGRALGV